jgi:methylated-DNA-[protein]-cysteine S-methyltransferase
MNAIFTSVATPLGPIVLTVRHAALAAAHFGDQKIVPAAYAHAKRCDSDALLLRARDVLLRYFETATLDADLPLCAVGTPFQERVWRAIARIPAGDTCTYGDIARELGAPDAVRAVGAATGRNPLCIFIPCHRVIGSQGALTGYAGGLDRKRALLALEQRADCLFAGAA